MNRGPGPHGDETARGEKIEARTPRVGAQYIGLHQAQHLREEFSAALRALLMIPLMTSSHAEFAAVRRHSENLREWFARETGWVLHVERDCARLFKRPADLLDSTRGFPDYDRRRYVLFCLVCVVLERADPQITLRVLGDRLPALGGDRTCCRTTRRRLGPTRRVS